MPHQRFQRFDYFFPFKDIPTCTYLSLISSVINFALLGTANCDKRSINPFQNKPWFLRVCSTSLVKTLWEKENLLVTSNIPFPTLFSIRLEYFLPFSLNLKVSSANFLVWKSPKNIVWERVKGCSRILFRTFV